MSEYAEKLKDPRWQKKRLKVMERDGWKCLCCDREGEMLTVHHLVYCNGEPWDEPDENLETLCESCHQFREDFNDLSGGRTRVPTKLIYAFVRWTLKSKYVEPEHRFGSLGFFLHFVAPEFLPKSMNEKFGEHENRNKKPTPATE